MALRVLLDTNAASAVLRGNPDAQRVLALVDDVLLCPIVLGELYYGAQHATLPDAQQARIHQLDIGVASVTPDTATARIYGQIKSRLRRTGSMIPDNDLWIASLALQYGLSVMTLDAHFASVDGLAMLAW